MTFGAAAGSLLVGDAGAVVCDLEAHALAGPFHPYGDGAGTRVLLHVAHRLAGGAEQQELGLRVDRECVVDDEGRGDVLRAQRREQVGERGLEPGRAQVGRVDLDEERAQAADRVAAERCPRRSESVRSGGVSGGARSAAALNP